MIRDAEFNKICAVISIYNIGDEIYKNINATYNQVDKIILVVDGSDKETLEILKEIEKNEKIKVIYNKVNLGIAVSLNKGINYALNNKFKWILTLDQDSEILPNMINNMIDKYYVIPKDVREKVMIIAPKHIDIDIYPNYISNQNKYGYEFVNVEITSGNLIKSDLFKKIGVYNERLFIDFVDVEFCLRIKREGYYVIRANNALMNHKIGNSEQHRFLFKKCICTNHNPIRRYYITRNRLYVWKEYFYVDKTWILRDIISFIGEMIKIVLWENKKLLKFKMIKKGIYDYKNNIYGKLS